MIRARAFPQRRDDAMADDLSAPMRRRKDRIRATLRRRLRLAGGFPLGRLLLVLVGLILCGLALRIVLVTTPNGGRPVAEAAINSTRGGNALARAASQPPSGPVTITAGPEIPADAVPAAVAAATSDNGATPPVQGPAITTLGPAGAAAAPAPPAIAGGLDPALVEQSKEGPLPRIGRDGRTPFAAYARPVDSGAVAGKPRVAIVVTGLGLSQSGTMDAIGALPGDVSLAFAPYGKTLDETVPAARKAGHELLLEAPMEPFDYPDNDPGPKTLLTSLDPRANLDRLFWLLTRFGGYVGLTNYMGARFTSSAKDFAPIMEELGARGLGYLDDGSSNRSIAPQLADRDNVPFARADLLLDADPSRDAIVAQLSTLEDDARQHGQAIGMISALPVSVQTIADWANSLDSKGLALVPVSALMK